jgi:hypothetical protein
MTELSKAATRYRLAGDSSEASWITRAEFIETATHLLGLSADEAGDRFEQQIASGSIVLETVPLTPEKPDICIDTIGGNCPVQAEGEINGWPFYFRARGQHWSLEVAEPGFQACGEAVWETFVDYGDEPFAAGWMEEDEARGFIASAAAQFLEWRAAHPEVDGKGKASVALLRRQLRKAWTSHGEQTNARLEAEREVVKLSRMLGLNPSKYAVACAQVDSQRKPD